MEEIGTLTETGGAPDTRRDEPGGAESATTLMDTDLPDYEDDTDERVLDEDSGDETEETSGHMENTALSQDSSNESPAKDLDGIAEKNRLKGYNVDKGEPSKRKGMKNIPPPPPLASGGGTMSNKSEIGAGLVNGSLFPPQYQTIRAKKMRAMEATNLNGIGDFDRGGSAARSQTMGFDIPDDDRQFAVKNFYVCSNVSVSAGADLLCLACGAGHSY
jgi:hypothetical protein